MAGKYKTFVNVTTLHKALTLCTDTYVYNFKLLAYTKTKYFCQTRNTYLIIDMKEQTSKPTAKYL